VTTTFPGVVGLSERKSIGQQTTNLQRSSALRNGEVSEKTGSGSPGDEFSEVMEGLLAAGVGALKEKCARLHPSGYMLSIAGRPKR
jgi:hypothetical protein